MYTRDDPPLDIVSGLFAHGSYEVITQCDQRNTSTMHVWDADGRFIARHCFVPSAHPRYARIAESVYQRALKESNPNFPINL